MLRREFLGISGAIAGLWLFGGPGLARPVGGRRFVFIIQRGAADGLETVLPVGDPQFLKVRPTAERLASESVKLDADFALHPALQNVAKLYSGRQALFVHAVASRYRDRSHFDAQNILESGGSQPFRLKEGWLNRLAGLMPGDGYKAVALDPVVPLALRGPASTLTYAPSSGQSPSEDLLPRLTAMYAEDPALGPLWEAALEANAIATGDDDEVRKVADLAARFLSREDGPRIAMVESIGWDTHYRQHGRMQARLSMLDKLVGSLKTGLGDIWQDTTVVVATEFGRTAAINGTGGTDHGTASLAIVLGGAVAGGRVVADWPGLGAAQLYEGRDLRPTASLEALIAGAAAGTVRRDPDDLARILFPDLGERAITGLIA